MVDTTAPDATATLVPLDVDDDEGRFRIEDSCSDTCDDEPNITFATLNGIAVANGQIVELELDDETEIEWDDGVLEIEASSFTLTVTCEDSSGNVGSSSVSPLFSSDDDDDDDYDQSLRPTASSLAAEWGPGRPGPLFLGSDMCGARE